VLGGQNYKTVAYLQIFVLAWIPVIIFFLAKALHNRVSGVIAAVLIILREANSISISGNITASHVKLLMVDLFSALAVLIFVYLTIVWLQAIEQRTLCALVCGGLVGLSMLIRLENFVFLFPLAAITGILLGARKRYKLWVKQMALVLWGVLLVISPWVWRNWQLTGLVFIDSPIWRYGLLAQRYSPKASSTPELTRFPAESPGASIPQAASPVVTPPGSPAPTLVPATPVPGEQIVPRAEEALDFIMKNPGRVALLWVTHFLNSQIQTMLILPTTSRSIDSFIRFMGHRSPERFWYECCSVLNYVRRMPYWHRWDGRFPSQAIVPLIINTVIFAIGIHETWKKRKIVGITPLIFGITYLVFNSLFRNSGGRYILPVDWNSVLYFSIGLGGLSIGIIGYLTQRQVLVDPPFQLNPEEHPTRQKSLFRSPQFYAITAGFFLLGCLIPLVERGFPQIYTEPRKDKMLSALFASELIPESQRLDIQTFLSNGGAVAAGRALYPVFLPPDTPVTQITNSPLEPKPYSRIDFFLVGPDRLSDLILPLAEKPALFPNASDVLVFHCLDREVLAVAIFDSSASPEAVLMRSPLPGVLSCPLPPG
jgi:hypothetical protein